MATLVIVGDGPVAAALEPLSRLLEWTPVVATTAEQAEQAIDDADAVVVLAHHDAVDGPALKAALAADGLAYVAGMGSRRTQVRRRDWLLEHDVAEADVDRIHGPAGLDIGADTPPEIALSIMAELVAVTRGRDATDSLKGRTAPLHPELGPGEATCPTG